MPQSFDIVIIGGGPGGYTGAIRAGQLGFSVACVEKRSALGGTCLNIGCIPSKALLHVSELYEQARLTLPGLGVKTNGVALNLSEMMAHKTTVVSQNTKGIEFLFKKNKVTHIVGEAAIAAPGRVAVKRNGADTETIEAKHIVIATGSDSMPLSGVAVDEQRIVSSTGGLSLNTVPKRLLVVGAGYIGLELGSVWRRLGAEVTVIEFLDRITPGLDLEIAKSFQRILSRQGMKFELARKVTKVDGGASGALRVITEGAEGGDPKVFDSDVVLVAIGRRAYTAELGLDRAGVRLDNRGRVVTDAHFGTNVPGIFAIGDVREGPMLAHKAEDEGIALVEQLRGLAGHVNYDAIPAVVYTAPEVASVGKTEEELRSAGRAYKTGKFSFAANARARVNATAEGFVKILADAKTDEILGAHMIGPDVGNMIGELALAMEFRASAEDVARTCHAHPTLAEAIRQAAMGVGGWTIQA